MASQLGPYRSQSNLIVSQSERKVSRLDFCLPQSRLLLSQIDSSVSRNELSLSHVERIVSQIDPSTHVDVAEKRP
jgi:hypothetical protein